MPRHPVIAILTFIVIAGLLLPTAVRAHKVSYVTVAASFDTRERTFSVEMAMEIDPTEDAQLNAQISPEMAAGTFATEVLSLYFGDAEVSLEPKIDLVEPTEEDEIDVNFPDRRKVLVTLAGAIPEATDYFTLHLSEDNEATVIMVKIVDGKPGRRAEVLYPGEFSTPVDIREIMQGDPFEPAQSDTAKPADSADPKPTFPDKDTDNPGPAPGSEAAGNGAAADLDKAVSAGPSSSWHALSAGFQKVLPQGFEMLSALLAMFFFSPKSATRMRQLAVFIVALSCALALSTLADFNAATPHLDMLVPLSVAVLAAENLFHSRLRWWRMITVTLAGLLFGLWLAPQVELTPGAGIVSSAGTVVAHLLGLVLGIIAALALLHVATASVRERPWYAKSVAFPASLIALGLAAFWVVERW